MVTAHQPAPQACGVVLQRGPRRLVPAGDQPPRGPDQLDRVDAVSRSSSGGGLPGVEPGLRASREQLVEPVEFRGQPLDEGRPPGRVGLFGDAQDEFVGDPRAGGLREFHQVETERTGSERGIVVEHVDQQPPRPGEQVRVEPALGLDVATQGGGLVDPGEGRTPHEHTVEVLREDRPATCVVDGGEQPGPGVLQPVVAAAVAVGGEAADPGVEVRRIAPGEVGEELEEHAVVVDRLHRQAEAGGWTGRGERGLELVPGPGQVGDRVAAPAEVEQPAPLPGPAGEAVLPRPDRRVLGPEVEDEQGVMGHGIEEGPHPLTGPVVRLVRERPGLQDPDGVRLGGAEAAHQLPRYAGGEVVVLVGRRGLDERVGRDVGDGAEPLLLDPHHLGGEPGEPWVVGVEEPGGVVLPLTRPRRVRSETVRHVPGEAGEHRRHAQRAHPLDDPPPEPSAPLEVVGGELDPVAVAAAHVLERQVERFAEEAQDGLVVAAEAAVDVGQHGLVAGQRQRHGDAVQRHPVDLALPVRPRPVRRGVAERAEVQHVLVADTGADGALGCLGDRRDGQGRPGGPVDGGPVLLAQVIVQAGARADRVARRQLQAAVAHAVPEPAAEAGIPVDRQPAGEPGARDPLGELADGGFVGTVHHASKYLRTARNYMLR